MLITSLCITPHVKKKKKKKKQEIHTLKLDVTKYLTSDLAIIINRADRT